VVNNSNSIDVIDDLKKLQDIEEWYSVIWT
jgi:hypothetical protein